MHFLIDKKQNASQVSLVISFSQVKVGGGSGGEGGGVRGRDGGRGEAG